MILSATWRGSFYVCLTEPRALALGSIRDLEIDEIWVNNYNKQGKSLERYVFDGVVGFMKENNLTPDELYNYEDETEIFDYIHS